MKTLIINGSPRMNGDTSVLIDEFTRRLEGEARIVTLRDGIAPCADCRYCWTHAGCAIDDAMQEIYRFHEECDNVVLASPIWYSSLSGPLLNITSRMQTLFAARFKRGERREADKNGVLILTGAQARTKDAPEQAALVIMGTMRVKRPLAARVYSLNTDALPAAEDAAALAQARAAAETLNKLYRTED